MGSKSLSLGTLKFRAHLSTPASSKVFMVDIFFAIIKKFTFKVLEQCSQCEKYVHVNEMYIHTSMCNISYSSIAHVHLEPIGYVNF